jgi:hypothetical protein
MGQIKLTKKEVARVFTKEMLELEPKFPDPTVIEYSVSYGQMIKAMSFTDLLEDLGEQAEENKFNPADYAFDRLQARVGRKRASSKNNLTAEQEQYLLAKLKSDFDDQQAQAKAEQERFNRLTPKEQAQETQEILSQLQKSPGFMAFGVNKPNKKKK